MFLTVCAVVLWSDVTSLKMVYFAPLNKKKPLEKPQEECMLCCLLLCLFQVDNSLSLAKERVMVMRERKNYKLVENLLCLNGNLSAVNRAAKQQLLLKNQFPGILQKKIRQYLHTSLRFLCEILCWDQLCHSYLFIVGPFTKKWAIIDGVTTSSLFYS